MLRAAGIPSRPNVAPRPLRNIAEYSVNALRTGKLRDLDFLQPYRGRPDVLYANPLVEAGDRVSLLPAAAQHVASQVSQHA